MVPRMPSPAPISNLGKTAASTKKKERPAATLPAAHLRAQLHDRMNPRRTRRNPRRVRTKGEEVPPRNRSRQCPRQRLLRTISAAAACSTRSGFASSKLTFRRRGERREPAGRAAAVPSKERSSDARAKTKLPAKLARDRPGTIVREPSPARPPLLPLRSSPFLSARSPHLPSIIRGCRRRRRSGRTRGRSPRAGDSPPNKQKPRRKEPHLRGPTDRERPAQTRRRTEGGGDFVGAHGAPATDLHPLCAPPLEGSTGPNLIESDVPAPPVLESSRRSFRRAHPRRSWPVEGSKRLRRLRDAVQWQGRRRHDR